MEGSWAATRCLRTLQGHPGGGYAVAALGGDRVVSGAWQRLDVWSVASGDCVQTLRGHESTVKAVAALDSDRIVSGVPRPEARLSPETSAPRPANLRSVK